MTGRFKLYKKLGAAQFTLLPPRAGEKGYLDQEGGVLIEAAPGAGEQTWDWDQKINFAIGIADICSLLENLQAPKKLIHEKNGVVKSLQFSPGEGKYEGTYMLNLRQEKDGVKSQVSVPVSGGEYALLTRMLIQTAPYLVGWL